MQFPYVLRMRELDAKTRGIYIELACNIERILDDIICKCEIVDIAKRAIFRKDKIMHLEMGKKLSRAIKSLRDYNLKYYNQYMSEFDIIADLVEYRNVMAHGYSEYDPKEIDDRYITYYNKEKNKIARYVLEPREFIKNLLVFQESLIKLVDLIRILDMERGIEIIPPNP